MYNLTSRQAKGFLGTVRKHMNVFKTSQEFGWTEHSKDIREFIVIHNKKFNCHNSVRSYPCALKSSDATISFIYERVIRRETWRVCVWLVMVMVLANSLRVWFSQSFYVIGGPLGNRDCPLVSNT